MKGDGRPLNGLAVKAAAAILGTLLTFLAANGAYQLLVGDAVSVQDGGEAPAAVRIVAPAEPLELQPVDICRGAKAGEVKKEPAPNVNGTSYVAVLVNPEGTRSWFIRWTDSPDPLVSQRIVIEAKQPDPLNPGQTVKLEALPEADQATIDCLKRRAV